MKSRALIGAVVLIVSVASGCGGSKVASTTVKTTTKLTPAQAHKRFCKSFGALQYQPDTCLTKAQLAKRKARLRAAAIAAAKARAAERKRAAEAAKRAAEAEAAANAWHAGYFKQDENIYWRWRDGLACADYATDGCWHIEVITSYGCASYVAVHANEYEGGAIINELLANQGYGIPPKTPRVFELDADAGSVTAGDVSVECN